MASHRSPEPGASSTQQMWSAFKAGGWEGCHWGKFLSQRRVGHNGSDLAAAAEEQADISAMPFVVAGPAGGLFCLVSEATEKANNFLPAIN